MVNINDYPLTLTDIVHQSARNLDPPMNLPTNWTSKLAVCSLKLDNGIKILDSDKNLGPVVADTTWYYEQCFLTLTDESTYKGYYQIF